MVREMFWQITQKLWVRLGQIVYISVFCNISFTGWFPVYFFVLCLLRDSENDLQGLVRTFFMLNIEWTNFKNVSLSQFLNGNESYAPTFWELKWHETWAKEVLVGGNYCYFLIYAKLFPYTISDSESQTPPLRFFLRGGGVCTQAIKKLSVLQWIKKARFRIEMTTSMSPSYNCKLKTLLLTRSACDFVTDFLDIVYCLFTGGDAWQIDVYENKV